MELSSILRLPPDCAEKYEPLDLLGSGGFGVVLRPRQAE